MGAPQRVSLEVAGDSSKASSERQDSGRTVNLFPEVVNGKPALRAAPGFFRWADLSASAPADAQIRGFHTMGSRFFLVVGPKVLEVQRDLTLQSFFAATVLATLTTSKGRVGLSDNNNHLVVGDGLGFWTLDLATKTLAKVLDDPGDGEPIAGFYSVWLDGTTLFFEGGSSKYWYSEINDPTTVKGLSFFSAEFSPDATLAAHALNGEIVILGERSTEWHADTGDADNPFQRIGGGHVEYGCIGRWANCRYGDTVAMVGRTMDGQGRVYLLGGAGSEPQPISTPAVEKAIEKVLFGLYGKVEAVTMWAQQDGGHEFLFLNLPAAPATVNNLAQPSMTWCFDKATEAWHERAYSNPATGQFERILSDFHVLYNGRHYTGDYTAPNIYEMAHDYFRENTLPLVKLRTCPRLYFNGRRFRVTALEIRGETGRGRDGAVQGAEPQLMLRYRWDGKPWSNVITRPWGALGRPETRALFGPMGSGVDFEVEIACSEPIDFVLTSGWADVTMGA